MTWASIPDDQCVTWEDIDSVLVGPLQTGPTPSLSQTDPGLPSGVDAVWTNPTGSGGHRIQIQWFINTGLVHTSEHAPATTTAHLSDCDEPSPGPDCVTINDGDSIEARIRYILPDADSIAGNLTAGNVGSIVDNYQLTNELDLSGTLPNNTSVDPGQAVKQEIEAAKATAGTFGSMSSPITYSVV
jgi:hypothetical protein